MCEYASVCVCMCVYKEHCLPKFVLKKTSVGINHSQVKQVWETLHFMSFLWAP